MPPVSDAVAESWIVAGALNTELFGGLVSETCGGEFVDWTVTEPTIKVWAVQKYGKSPAAVNLLVKVKPELCKPEFHKPSLLVVE